jgi:hypothetical protein
MFACTYISHFFLRVNFDRENVWILSLSLSLSLSLCSWRTLTLFTYSLRICLTYNSKAYYIHKPRDIPDGHNTYDANTCDANTYDANTYDANPQATTTASATHAHGAGGGLPGNDKQVLKTLKQAQVLRAVGKEIKRAGSDVQRRGATVRETARERLLEEKESEYKSRDQELRDREKAEAKQLLDSMDAENDIVFGGHDTVAEAEARQQDDQEEVAHADSGDAVPANKKKNTDSNQKAKVTQSSERQNRQTDSSTGDSDTVRPCGQLMNLCMCYLFIKCVCVHI